MHSYTFARSQEGASEVHTDWEKWADLDYVQATEAAEFCGMHVAAILYAELSQNASERGSRRSSVAPVPAIPDGLLLQIYGEIDEPDSFYGVRQSPTLGSVLKCLDYEGDGMKSLIFRGAQIDSEVRRKQTISSINSRGMISSLVNLNMSSLTKAIVSSKELHVQGGTIPDEAFQTARRLEQWDIKPTETPLTEASVLYTVFQGINAAVDVKMIRNRVNASFSSVLKMLLKSANSRKHAEQALRTLGILAEVDAVMTSTSVEQLEDAWVNINSRKDWMLSAQ